jgi:ActR/RegA family two-component response regulator
VPAILKTLQGPLASNEAFEDLEALLAVDRGTAKELMEICQRTKNAMVQIERLLLSADRAGQQARVLVVDGDQTFAMRARRELQKHVKSVWLANSCSEALVRIDGNVSCAAINVALPDGSGIELSAALRRRYPRLACVFTVGAEASAPSAVIDGRDIVVPRTSGLRHLSVAVLKALPPDDSAAAPPLAV